MVADTGKTIKIELFRYHPEKDSEPRFEAYEVPFEAGQSLLDGLRWVRAVERTRLCFGATPRR